MMGSYRATITVTGKAGPGITVTAAVYENIPFYAVDVANSVLQITKENGEVVNISLGTTLTWTTTVSTGNQTVSIS